MASDPAQDAPASLTKAPNIRAADDVFRYFAQQINAGVLREGEALPPEREIVQTFGVSRTVVREAVTALANKGLVEARPRFRPVVRKPNFDTAFDTVDSVAARLLSQSGGIKNMFDTRIMIEASLVRQAATGATKEDVAALKQALAENETAINDSATFFATDIRFHAILFEVPRNPILPAIHKAYATWLGPHWKQMPRRPNQNRINYDAHKAIYDAILMRDPDSAELALRAHLADAWEQVEATFATA